MDNLVVVKQEKILPTTPRDEPIPVIDLCRSDDEEVEVVGSSERRRYNSGNTVGAKRARHTFEGSSEVDMNDVNEVTGDDELRFVLPEGFGQSNPPEDETDTIPADPCNVFVPPPPRPSSGASSSRAANCKQFWKAGDYEGSPDGNWDISSGGLEHVRVHPKFLHSNATSHKWALGAFAELLDNALDEVSSGATYVNIDMLQERKSGNRMLLIEDNGGGMDPKKMRHCMSLGYSAKSEITNTIGQYGNGFKTSTMRLGADVIVFTRSPGKAGKSSTQSIGLLSYTFLRSTGKEDLVVPMLDYERRGTEWSKTVRSSLSDWDKNVKEILQWSPFSSEEDLLRQFDQMKDRGTRIIIYNLWEDDQGLSELDFDADPQDIQLRGVNRDEKNIEMASKYHYSKHYLTYRHSLRSYVSILYLRIPPRFRILLRGIDVEHHNVVNDMKFTEPILYRPQYGPSTYYGDPNMATGIMGFVKDAEHHMDIQGFNVYHKNRLIKPFWRVWTAAGSDGRGVIGVLEANFIEPAHDKQGFERTNVLSRLETRLAQIQKDYWRDNCHLIGYAPRRNQDSAKREKNGEGSVPTPPSDGDNGVDHAASDGEPSWQAELRREKERSMALEADLKSARQTIEVMAKEKESLTEMFTQERDRRDAEEEILTTRLEEASNTIEELLDKIRKLEASVGPSWRR